ncbi:MAG: UDP-glucose 4-epimerase GalE [Hyphomonadaceae bacterium]
MTVLVTGGAGYIGSHMALALLDRGEDVVVLDSLVTGFREAVPEGAVFIEGDVGDHETVARLFSDHKIDAVTHFAASTVVPDSISDPLGYYANNTLNAHALLSEVVRAGVPRFVFSSTAAVYGSNTEEPVRETTATNPESPYGSSKLMSERILRDTAEAHDFSFAILRYFNVAGADPAGRAGQSARRATHLIKVCSQAALGLRDGVDVYGTDFPTPDGTGVRDYIHVTDLIAAHMLALDHLRGQPARLLFNCGYGKGFSVLEVVEAVRRVSGVNFDARMSPRRPGDPASVVANGERLRSELGWAPQYDDLDTIVAHALAWEKKISER